MIGEKLKQIQLFFDSTEGYGMNFFYNLIELMRQMDEKINLARFVYLLSRMEPEERKGEEEKTEKMQQAYRQFSEAMYRWIRNKQERKEAITAAYLYVYNERTEEEEEA
ncbi:MAG: hypothetical protein Q4D90_11185 [bacterium]|nr:hypothetical protein [bacterium]